MVMCDVPLSAALCNKHCETCRALFATHYELIETCYNRSILAKPPAATQTPPPVATSNSST